MKVELLGGATREELEKRIRMVASAGKLSQYPGNVFEVFEDSQDYAENLKVIKRITKMGHKSIMEHDYLVFAIADVTPIVEQTIIGNRLTSFTIKSRRYVDFREAGFYVPTFRNTDYSIHLENKELQKKYKKHMRYLFKEYSALVDSGVPNEDARFILPYSFHSNIVMGLDARELEKLIIYLLYGEVSKIQELYELGEKLFAIAKKWVPYIADNISKYKKPANDCDFKELFIEYSSKPATIVHKPLLLDYTVSPDDTVIEYGIMSATQCGYDEAGDIIANLEAEEPDFKEKYITSLIHSEEARELEQVSFTFQIPISLAVLTHLTRHRMHSLLVPSFVPLWNFNNYIVPETIKQNPKASLFEKAVKANMEMLEEFKNVGVVEEDLVYFYLGAQMCNVVTTINARSFMWISRMRCCNRAQWQIRNIVKSMAEQVKSVAPLISKGLGPNCVVNHTCPEGAKSCGLIKEILKAES